MIFAYAEITGNVLTKQLRSILFNHSMSRRYLKLPALCWVFCVFFHMKKFKSRLFIFSQEICTNPSYGTDLTSAALE